MIDAPDWFVYAFDLLMIVVFVLGILILKAWMEANRTKGKMWIDIREPTGFTERHLVKPDPAGATVTFENCVYMLTKSPSADIPYENENNVGKNTDVIEENTFKHYPRIRFVRSPKNPFLGLPMLQTTLRIEEYQRDNPEPIHPFYGRVDEKGMFIENQLTITGTEWNAQKGVMQASQLAMRIQAIDTLITHIEKIISSIPNKVIVYLLSGIGAICSALAVLFIYQLAGM